jgi:hypothetical protein
MSQEHIILEEIRLTSVNPSTLGYLEQVVPEPDNLRMHTIRIRKYLPEKHPKFQLFSKTLYDSRRRGTRVVMIKCDEEDYDVLQDHFLTLNTQQVLNFFPWKEFTSLNDPLRDTAFQKAFNFNKNYRSVTMGGFRDNEDNIPMRYKVRHTGQVENAVTDPMGTMLVSDYLGTLTAANGTKLFSHVYEPIAGFRDTLVHVDNFTEAKEFAKVALNELGREMNSASRLMVFRDYQEIEEAMNCKPKWKPFTKAAELIKDREQMESHPVKRSRIESGKPIPYPGWRNLGDGLPSTNSSTNKNDAKNDKKSSYVNAATNSKPTNNPTWDDIQRHVEERIENTTKILRTEIRDNNEVQSQRMDEIDKKIENYSQSTDNKLDKINSQCDNNAGLMDTRFNRLEFMFEQMMGKTTQTSSNNANIMVEQDMDFQLTRDELLLKRSRESKTTKCDINNWEETNKENNHIHLLQTQPDGSCEGNAVKMRK